MAFNKTKNYQRFYALIYTEAGNSLMPRMIGKRALLFRSKDGESARSNIEKENKGSKVKLICIGRDSVTPARDADKFNIELEFIGDV